MAVSLLVASASFVTVLLLRGVIHDRRALAEVDEPLRQAALEMEISVGETARSVSDYVGDQDANDLEAIRSSRGDFQRYSSEFSRLATTEQIRALGLQVNQLYEDFTQLADEITLGARRRHDELEAFRLNVREVDRLIDRRLQADIDRTAPGALTKLEAALVMEINMGEAFSAIEAYVLEADTLLKNLIRNRDSEFVRRVQQYRGTRLSPQESQVLAAVGADFAQTLIVGREVMDLTDSLRAQVARFDGLLMRIDRVLDDDIEALIQEQTARADEDAARAGYVATVVVLGSGLLVVILVAGMGRSLTNDITGSAATLAHGEVRAAFDRRAAPARYGSRTGLERPSQGRDRVSDRGWFETLGTRRCAGGALRHSGRHGPQGDGSVCPPAAKA